MICKKECKNSKQTTHPERERGKERVIEREGGGGQSGVHVILIRLVLKKNTTRDGWESSLILSLLLCLSLSWGLGQLQLSVRCFWSCCSSCCCCCQSCFWACCWCCCRCCCGLFPLSVCFCNRLIHSLQAIQLPSHVSREWEEGLWGGGVERQGYSHHLACPVRARFVIASSPSSPSPSPSPSSSATVLCFLSRRCFR